MLEQLETLVVLSEAGTMTRAATRLRLTQSAVSKRVASLEAELGETLVEHVGRHVRLTGTALELIARTRPLLAAIRDAVSGERELARGRIVLGVSESLLTSWAPRALVAVQRAVPELELEVHAHRSPVCVDGVRAGELTLALVAGTVDGGDGLFSEPLCEEEMVLVDVRAPTLRRGTPLWVTTIERRSATFRALAPQLTSLRQSGFVLEVARELESFAAVAQLARAGFGASLVPWPLARALGVTPKQISRLPGPGLTRPVSLVGRKTAFARPLVAAFTEALRTSVPRA